MRSDAKPERHGSMQARKYVYGNVMEEHEKNDEIEMSIQTTYMKEKTNEKKTKMLTKRTHLLAVNKWKKFKVIF